MQLASRQYLATKGVTQRPLLTIEGILGKDGYPTTFVAEPYDQRSKITGQPFNREDHPASLLTDPAPPSALMRTFRLLLGEPGQTPDGVPILTPLSIHQDLPSMIHFINQHRQLGRSPLLYRLSEEQVGWTLSSAFDLFCQVTFQTVDRYDRTTRQGLPTINQTDDAPWAVVLPKSKTIRVEGVLCEQFTGQNSIKIEEATMKTPFTIMVRDFTTKEPLSLHNTTESILFYGQRHTQSGKMLELVNGEWDTISL